MHGAAQTANAPPSSNREPEPRACCSRPGATARSGHGSAPRNARPSTIRTKPAISYCERWLTALPTAAAAAPSTTNTTVKPSDEGQARRHDLPRDAALAEPRDLDRRERREVARDERQHARRDHGDEAGEERDRAASQASKRASSASSRASSSGARRDDGLAPARRGGRATSTTRRAASPAAPSEDPADRQHPGEQVEAVRRGRREHAAAVVRDHLVEDLLLAPALGDPPADLRLHLLRDGRRRLVERLVADRADELRLELGLARARGGERRRRERERQQGAGDDPHVASARRAPAVERRVRDRAEHVVDDPAAAVDEERLRRRRDPPRPDRRAGRVERPSDTSRRSAA